MMRHSSLLLCLLVAFTSALVAASESSTDRSGIVLEPTDSFWSQPGPDRFRVRFETSEGDFVVEAQRAWAPLGVDRFYNLVRAGFYDDSRFFRVRAGYIAQFGIAGDPVVAAVWRDRAFDDDPVRETNTRGRVGYAMTGPDTRTTQLYINLVDNAHLDDQGFAPIGEVIEGMEVVERLYAGYDESAGGGMRGGKQVKIFSEGNEHLDREFPNLSKLERAVIE
jgi:homoserine O-acetyltransferase